jgi:muramoyltetrapeptide carboxypeptidase
MMIQLKRTGQLAELAGLIVGHFSNLSDDPSIYGKTAYEIVEEAVAEYEYPRSYGFPVGTNPKTGLCL